MLTYEEIARVNREADAMRKHAHVVATDATFGINEHNNIVIRQDRAFFLGTGRVADLDEDDAVALRDWLNALFHQK